ncbi:MAG: iron-containing alcohol dehydrogenase [Anaerolineae bacterium]|nr:iron-containing alcohol dehydrogenase [Anaerolineae bacterium]
MIKTMRSPQYFVVGAGASGQVGEHAAQFGTRALVIGGNRALEAAKPTVLPSLEAGGLTYHLEQGDHVRKTLDSVNHLVAIGRQQKVDLVIGCGGGAVMDCGKAVAHDLGVQYIALPTTAGVNAAGTSGAGIEGDPGPRRRWYQAVDVVIADTAIIARAGGRYLASGMGDALPSKYGAQLAQWRGAPDVTASRLAFARLCSDTILADGARAYRACQRGMPTEEVDRVVEAVLYQSGMGGFGMGGDHVLHPARMPGARADVIHGEWVAFGLLVRVVLGGEFSEDLPALIAFDRSVNLPTTFADFGLHDPGWPDVLEEARRIVGPAGQADYGIGRPVTPEDVCEAMFEVDYLGRTLA